MALSNQNNFYKPWWIERYKYSPLTVAAYNLWLNILCRKVECYIFVATTGRSGTSSLSKIFNEVLENAVCLHEPPPVMNSNYTRAENFDRDAYFRKSFFNKKRINIKRAAAGHSYYIETNHQFIKNFASPAIDHFGNKIRIVHLQRDPVKVASSFYSINSIPGKTKRARFYLLDPDEKSNLIKIPEIWNGSEEFSHDFYRCLWYWYEIEARVLALKKKYPQTICVDVNTEQLNDKSFLAALFKKLNIKVSEAKFEKLGSICENLRLHEKKAVIDHELALHMNAKLRKRIEQLNGQNILSPL